MKAGLLALAALSAVASAQPHRRHQQLHEQRDVVVETQYQTQTEYVVATAPAVVVYVDEHGNQIKQAEPTPAASPEAPVVNNNVARPNADFGHGQGRQGGDKDNKPAPAPTTSSTTPPAPAYTPPPSPEPVAPAPVAPAPAPASSQAPAPASQPTTVSPPTNNGGDGNGLGLTYSPYNSDGTCKSANQVKTDIDALPAGYKLIRLYGTDCSQISNVMAAGKSHGYKYFLGIFDINSIASEVASLAKQVGGEWSSVDTVAVGNEGVNNGQYGVPQVAAAVVAAKAALTLAGYTGPVVTVDTFVAIINNPALCAVGDYVAANCHAFFDGGVTGSGAGDFVVSQAQRVSAACGGKKTVITESGWPNQGDSNHKAVASQSEQDAAISSLKKSFSSNLILFNAYNDGWKKDTPATFNAEKHWGMFGNHPSA